MKWARLATKLKTSLSSRSDLFQKVQEEFFNDLKEIHQIKHYKNQLLVLEATYVLGGPKKKKQIERRLWEKLPRVTFLSIKKVFPFIQENKKMQELEEKVKEIKEKCKFSVSRQDCKKCWNEPQGECWNRILGKLLDQEPKIHGSTEVADIIKYSNSKTTYFVIKAKNIYTKQSGGNTLIEQCSRLFTKENALVFYINVHKTADSIIEQIRELAENAKTEPKFVPLKNEFIRQIYAKYQKCYKA